MKRYFLIPVVALVLALGLISLTGCQNRTETGALIGGTAGMGLGGAIGGWSGACIGGAIGALGGALAGSDLDAQEQERLRCCSPRTVVRIERRQHLSPADIKAMAAAGIESEIIMSHIDQTHSKFFLTTADIIDLKNAGVCQCVIHYMIQTRA